MPSRSRSRQKMRQNLRRSCERFIATQIEATQEEERLEGENEAMTFAEDPVGFAYWLGTEFLTEQQQQILLSVRDNQTTNIQASHGIGKTFCSAIVALWGVFACNGLVVTTAPTGRQVKELLWKEIRRLYDRNKEKLGGRRGVLFVEKSSTAYAYGFASYNYSSDTFQGIHAERLIIILDEANGISEQVDDGANSCLTGAENRILRIGNPTVSGTPFFKACRTSHLRIPVWGHPNVAWAYEKNETGIHRLKPDIAKEVCCDNKQQPILPQSVWPEDFPRDKVSGAVSIAWIEKIRHDKGEQSAYWISRVEGFFPEDNAASIVPRSWFLAARQRYDSNPSYWDEMAAKHEWRFGLDVGDGGDAHALAGWRGSVLYFVVEVQTIGDRLDTLRAAKLGKKYLDKHGGRIAVDNIGVGAGTLATLLENKCRAQGVNWGAAPQNTARYLNLKAEMFWNLRDAFQDDNEIAVAPLGHCEDTAMEDLAGIWYEETATEKTRIEDKKKTKQRLGRSPNVGDAIVYGYGSLKQIAFQQGTATWGHEQIFYDDL